MPNGIYINDEAVENDATGISGAASYFMIDTLIPVDGRTTLTVNMAGQQAYTKSQQVISTLGENLEREVTNIRSIGASFTQYDVMMAELIRSGMRYLVWTSTE